MWQRVWMYNPITGEHLGLIIHQLLVGSRTSREYESQCGEREGDRESELGCMVHRVTGLAQSSKRGSDQVVGMLERKVAPSPLLFLSPSQIVYFANLFMVVPANKGTMQREKWPHKTSGSILNHCIITTQRSSRLGFVVIAYSSRFCDVH